MKEKRKKKTFYMNFKHERIIRFITWKINVWHWKGGLAKVTLTMKTDQIVWCQLNNALAAQMF